MLMVILYNIKTLHKLQSFFFVQLKYNVFAFYISFTTDHFYTSPLSPAPLWLCLHWYKPQPPHLEAMDVNWFTFTWHTATPPGADGHIHTVQTL